MTVNAGVRLVTLVLGRYPYAVAEARLGEVDPAPPDGARVVEVMRASDLSRVTLDSAACYVAPSSPVAVETWRALAREELVSRGRP